MKLIKHRQGKFKNKFLKPFEKSKKTNERSKERAYLISS